MNITLLPSINPPDYEGYARAAVEEGVKIFETAGNNRTSNFLKYSRTGNVEIVVLIFRIMTKWMDGCVRGWMNSGTVDQVLQIARVYRHS